MKKFVITLIACFAAVQSMHAATSPLTESLLEYEAITNAIGGDPSFQDIIPVTEFIVDIRRITRQINTLGEVRYEILTRTINDESGSHCHDSIESHAMKSKHARSIKYIATLNIAPNPGIGPNIVTVESIVRAHKNHH